jgi:rubrerythrin
MKDATSDRAPRPPGAPWLPIQDRGSGYLSVYLSEPLARWPIREVTRPRDNKSDPNIETGSYGLFSTCEPSLRRGVVREGAAHLFFMTSRKGEGRLLAGHYHIGWYTEGARGAENGDYALAADQVKFFEPISPADLPSDLGESLSAWFRAQKPVDAAFVARLLETVEAATDRTADYLEELTRVEQFSRDRSTFAYPSWGREQGFTWNDAAEYLEKPNDPADVPNSSASGKWRCSGCDRVIENRALLKRCPVCGKVATLRPETVA